MYNSHVNNLLVKLGWADGWRDGDGDVTVVVMVMVEVELVH